MIQIFPKKLLLFFLIAFISTNISAQLIKSTEQRLIGECRDEGHVQLRAEIKQLKRGGPTNEDDRARIIDSLYQKKALYKSQIASFRNLAAGDTIFPPPPLGTEETYANGALRGFWQINKVTNNQDGVRLDRTVYDSSTNRIYAINTMGSLVDGLMVSDGSLLRRNQAVIIEEKGFAGVKMPNGVFRLIGAINNGWTNGAMRYSDDHGVTWIESNGGEYTQKLVLWTDVMDNGNILSLVRRLTSGVDNYALIRSTNFGVSYSVVQTWVATTTAKLVATKIYNTADVCYFARKITNVTTTEFYKYENGAISLISSTTSSNKPSSMSGTFFGGTTTVYVGCESDNGFFSNNGVNFIERQSLFSGIETVVPYDPALIFSREPQQDYSLDSGYTWQKYPNNNGTIGWDPKHVNFYKRSNGNWVFVIANDMGLSFNDNPNPLSGNPNWKYVNDNHSYSILHGGFTHNETGLTISCHQDPGTFELTSTGNHTFNATKRQGADGLRATPSNNGRAYWFRHYWGQIYHRHNFNLTADNREAVASFTSADWYTPPFVGTTLPNEDAIYASGYDKLRKLTYNTLNNTITTVELPYDFTTQTGNATMGVGVAKANANRVYVATKGKIFYTSNNAGQTWQASAYTGSKPDFASGYNQSAGYIIEVADDNPDLVFWGGQKGAAAILKSTNAGQSFTPMMDGMPTTEEIRSLSFSSSAHVGFSSNFYIYFAAQNKWFSFKSPTMPEGIVVKSVNYLPSQNKVRFYTWGAGMLDFNITYLNPGGTLPLTLLNFNGKIQANNVVLNWATTNEINTAYFNVQRSTDGVNFINIAKVKANGNSVNTINYTFNDSKLNAFATSNNAYYRLQMFNADNSYTFSQIAEVKISQMEPHFVVSPNPVKHSIQLQLKNINNNATVKIIDLNGRVCYNKPLLASSNIANISAQFLAPGMYIIQIQTTHKLLQQKCIKE